MSVLRQIAVGFVALGLLVPVGSAMAEDSEEMMKALLRPAGWSAEWAGPGGSGLTEVIFERRAAGVFARIRLIVPFELTCENPVTVDKNSVTFDGCRDPAVTLAYDPSDATYPLRGRSPRGYEWKVRPK
jgi:hypothetical protein